MMEEAVPREAPSARVPSQPEIWGGLECTVNRVGDRYFDQFDLTGHLRRPEDLDSVAALGIKTLRYPVLWERTSPHRADQYDWSFSDGRLERIRSLGMKPIVGLLHHGSGPRYTGLADPSFPALLAAYARRVARRYPWVEAYTPVNEPLTTARFSGLYGHWYPHGRDDRTFVRTLLAQCRGTALAMRAIREINPEARLVQTEDLGKTLSTPALAYQAEFENHRRWLSLDLLGGKVDRAHPLRGYLLKAGASEEELDEFLREPCPPDIYGFNYYVTSERFLDDRLELYPRRFHGGNGRQAYADIEAVRACGISGLGMLLLEAWDRYRAPLAVTEVQLSGERENQLGWLRETWKDALTVRGLGIDLRALTAWSLFGASEWNTLVTRVQGFYESGAFDVRSDPPRPTALARVISELAAGKDLSSIPSLTDGWWRHPSCLLLPAPYPVAVAHRSFTTARRASARPPLLITGATGTLGRAFQRICEERHLPYRLVGRKDMDIADPDSVRRVMEETRPWALANTAGFVRVDEAERDEERCRRENTLGPSVLAEACAERGIGFLTFSTDLVFDGGQTRPYVESDPARPLNAYGRSKADAEAAVLARMPGALVVRTSAFFGPWDRHNFLARVLEALRKGEPLMAADDQTVSPTMVPDLVNACLDFLQDREAGLWHLANPGSISWYDLAVETARHAEFDPGLIVPRGGPGAGAGADQDADRPAPRPRYSVLGSERGSPLPTLENALERCLASLVSCSAEPQIHR